MPAISRKRATTQAEVAKPVIAKPVKIVIPTEVDKTVKLEVKDDDIIIISDNESVSSL